MNEEKMETITDDFYQDIIALAKEIGEEKEE